MSVLYEVDIRVRYLARMGINRFGHSLKPRLYALGETTKQSLVFFTANYALRFNALRSSLNKIHCYILVLDAKAVDVWCAADAGSFGTDEMVDRIDLVELSEVASHGAVVVPQLGTSGVAAHEVKRRMSFNVEYGPVRASNIVEYMKSGKATLEMRRVRFDLRE